MAFLGNNLNDDFFVFCIIIMAMLSITFNMAFIKVEEERIYGKAPPGVNP